MEKIDSDQERGFALPVAVFALIVVGVLVTGAFYMAQQESRIGAASENSAIAFYMAEKAVNDVLSNWDNAYFGMADFEDTTVTGSDENGTWTVNVLKTGPRGFFIDAAATVTKGGAVLGGASRRVGMIARLFAPSLDPPAALTTRGPTAVKGNAFINGMDTDPPNWTSGECDPYAADSRDKPGVLTDNAAQVDCQNCGGGGGGGKGGGGGGGGGGTKGITGDPAVEEDPNIDDDTFTVFGDMTWDELVQLANLTLPGGNYNPGPAFNPDGTCNTSVDDNWGDPENPGTQCGSYFPVVYIDGIARIQGGGAGQGILLVEDDMDVRGNFTWHGIIIVQGNFETQGSGNRILGGVMASNVNLQSQSYVGGSVINNSTCAASRAIFENSNLVRPRPLDRRSWVDMTGIDPSN